MSNEIKIQLPESEQAISELIGTSTSLKTSFPTSVADGQALDVASKLDLLNKTLNHIADAYRQMLIHHEAIAQETVQSLRQMDEKAVKQSKGGSVCHENLKCACPPYGNRSYTPRAASFG